MYSRCVTSYNVKGKVITKAPLQTSVYIAVASSTPLLYFWQHSCVPLLSDPNANLLSLSTSAPPCLIPLGTEQ